MKHYFMHGFYNKPSPQPDRRRALCALVGGLTLTWAAQARADDGGDWPRQAAVPGGVTRLELGPAPARPQAFADDAPLPDQAIGAEQQLAQAMKAIAALPSSLKDTLILRTIDEKSEAETAEILGISQKAVETRLYRARARLSEILKKV